MNFCSLDVKAIAYGAFVTLILSCTMVVAGLKAGITPGVSPLVVLCGWGAFRGATRGLGGSRFLNLAQVAGSAGMAIVSGVIFTQPLIQVLHLNRAQESLREMGVDADLKTLPWKESTAILEENGLSIPGIDIPSLILACLAGSFLGYGFVGLATRHFLSDPTLPAPEARACMSMINTAVSEGKERPRIGISLVLSVCAAMLVRVLVQVGLCVEAVALASKSLSSRTFSLALPVSSGPLYMGIGGLLTAPTAILTFSGAVLRLVGDYALVGVDSNGPLGEKFPQNSMRWVGGGAMSVAVAYSLLKFMRVRKTPPQEEPAAVVPDGRPCATENQDDESLLEIPKLLKKMLAACIAIGALIVAIWLLVDTGLSTFSLAMIVAILVMVTLMVPLGAILSLQIGSSSSPVSGTVFVTTLVLCVVALVTGHRSLESVPTITTLLVAACVAVCAANDVSQDYKTLQLCGVPPRDGFAAQLIGLLVGSIVVPFSTYVAANAYGLGTDALPAPQGQMFATLVEGLLISQKVPWYPILIGLVIGIFAVGLDIVGGKFGLQLPAMALAVGIYLSPDTGVGIMIGMLFRSAGEALRSQRQQGAAQEQTHECILASAGLITGSAFLDLVLGIALLFNFNDEELLISDSMPTALTTTVAVLCLLGLGWVLFHNSMYGTSDGSQAKAMKEEGEASSEGAASNGLAEEGREVAASGGIDCRS